MVRKGCAGQFNSWRTAVAKVIRKMNAPHKTFAGLALTAAVTLLVGYFRLVPILATDLPSIAFDPHNGDELGIQEMRVIGPFPLATDSLPTSINTSTMFGSGSHGKSGLDVDYLGDVFHRPETMVAIGDLMGIGAPNSIAGFVSRNVSTVYGPLHEKLYIDFKSLFSQSGYVPPKDALPGASVRELNTDLATAYAALQIESSADADAVLLAGADDAVRIWINTSLVFENQSIGPPPCENPHMQVIHLKKGANLVLAKVFNTGASWGLTLRLTTLQGARSRLARNATGKVLTTRVLTDGMPVKLSALAHRLYSEGQEVDAQLLNGRQQVTSTAKCAPGIYTAHLRSASEEARDTVYCGPNLAALPAFYEAFMGTANGIHDQDRINAEAVLYRLRHLLKPEHRKESDPGWQDKIISIIGECEHIFMALRKGRNVSQDTVGRHLRGFRSAVDGSVQHYMVYAPRQYKRIGKGVPLVVRMPYVTKPARHFLESYHVANTDLITPLEHSADRHGYVVVWPNGRSGTSVGHPVGIKDVFETIEAVKSDYDIADDRIYLLGGCSGGLEALTLASHYPARFAAIAVTSPIYHRENSSLEERLSLSSPETERAAAIWNSHNSADMYIRNLSNIPVLIVHEEAHRHAPIEPSFRYVQTARGIGNPVTMETINFGDNTVCPIRSPIARAFDFFRGKRVSHRPDRLSLGTSQMKYGDSQWLTIGEKLRDESPAKIEGKIITSNQLQIKTQNVKSYTIRFEVLGGHPQDWQIESNGVRLSPNAEVVTVDGAPSGKIGTRKVALREGPIVDAFASSFVIVPGTLGGLAERSATDTVVQQLRQQWKTTYYAELPVKADYQITAADRDNTNLILIGNEHTNQILRRLHEALTVHTDVKGVTLGGTRFAGNAIGFSLIKPNPENRFRYIVVIGANEMSQMRIPLKRPWLEAVYDYVVWSNQGSSVPPYVVDAGYFDSEWTRLTSVSTMRMPSSEVVSTSVSESAR